MFLACFKLLGDCRILPDHLFLYCLKLFGDSRVLPGHLFLACLKLLDANLELLDVQLHSGTFARALDWSSCSCPGAGAAAIGAESATTGGVGC